MNVLITSAGRRTSLVRAFQKAVRSRGGKVVAADTDGLASSLYEADVVVRVPRVRDKDYIPKLMAVIEANQIHLLVPTIDTELALLARSASLIESGGAHPLVSSVDLIDVLADKVSTKDFFGERGVPVVSTWLPN